METTRSLTSMLNSVQPQPYDLELPSPPATLSKETLIVSRITGSLIGLAVGDAVGAPVEFLSQKFIAKNRGPVQDMTAGGSHGLARGQWTDDTSMALCLAASLLLRDGFDAYDQMMRYEMWYRKGYLSSTGSCFDIGNATAYALAHFATWQSNTARSHDLYHQLETNRYNPDAEVHAFLSTNFDHNCAAGNSGGNGCLMRLAPIPLFYYRSAADAVDYAAKSAVITHSAQFAVDACKFYAAAICAAVQGHTKEELLRKDFYHTFTGRKDLCEEILIIADGSYKTEKPDDDIVAHQSGTPNGAAHVSLKAALWAFFNDKEDFRTGTLLAVNLGGDTDTIAAIYGQLAGAVYGQDSIPVEWRTALFKGDFIAKIAEWLFARGKSVPSHDDFFHF